MSAKIVHINGMAWDASHVPQQLPQPRQLVVHHIRYRRRDDYAELKAWCFGAACGFFSAACIGVFSARAWGLIQ